MIFQTIILAGGLATRLSPLSKSTPKALIPIKGKPFISYQLEKLKQEGVEHVVLCLGFLGGKIEDYLKTVNHHGLTIVYCYDGKELLGTAGAIRKHLDLLNDHFFVMYGDSYLSCNFANVQDAFLKSQKPALMTVFRNTNQWDKSNVIFKDGKILFYDKELTNPQMQHIDYGLGVFSKEAFSSIPIGQKAELATLYKKHLEEKNLAAYETTKRFYEVGSFTGIEEFSQYVL